MDCNTYYPFKYTHSVDCWDFQHKTINGIFVQLSKKPPDIFAPLIQFLNKFASVAALALLCNFPAFNIGQMEINRIKPGETTKI